MELCGVAAQEVSFGANQKFAQARVENRAARVTFHTDVRVGEFSAAPGATLAFDPGRILYADSLSPRGAENAPVRLGPAAAGDGWKVRLLPGGRQEIAFVECELRPKSRPKNRLFKTSACSFPWQFSF